MDISAMAVRHPRICFGNSTPCNLSSGICIGQMWSSRCILTKDWNSWPVIWLNPVFRGNYTIFAESNHSFRDGFILFFFYFFFVFLRRTDAAFQNHLKKGILLNPTEYILPIEICAMVNVVLDAKNQSFKLCSVDGVDVVRHSSRLLVVVQYYYSLQKKTWKCRRQYYLRVPTYLPIGIFKLKVWSIIVQR